MKDPLHRIYRLKVIIVAIASAVLGLGLMVFAKFAESLARLAWVRDLPVFELGSTLFITGAFVVAYDYLDGRDKEAREDARIRRLLAEAAPAMRDAVVRGFAIEPEDLRRVVTPDMLDEIATNALGLRLGDLQFAAELYADIRDQVVRA